MYRMLYNDNFLFDPFDETRIVSSASITTNVNAASYLDFTIAANHPLYNEIEQRSGIITLYSDNEKLFQGLITAIDMDMDGNKSVTCSSALDWLRDVQLRPYSTDQAECDEYEFKLDKAPDALDAYFQWLIDQYNAQNKDGRYFTINVNQAADLTRRSLVYFASTSPRSVADAIEDDILGTFGGYLVLRYDDDQLILDLYSDIHEMNEQVIDYGENILDISRNESTDDQYTAVYPIGKTPQYTAEQQKYHDEKAIYDEYMKRRDETERAAIAQLKKEEEAEQKRINGMPNGRAKKNAENALKKRKDQRQVREKAFSDETKRLQDAQKIKDDKNAADKTKPNPITIESLDNGGYPGDLDIFKEGDVVYSVSYVQRYGYKEFVYSDTDIEDKQLLLALAVAKLKSLMAPSLSIDVRAVDQALYNPKHTHLFAGQAVRVRSKPHGVDEFMMVSSIDLDLIDPSRTTATLGVAYDTLTGQQSSFLRNLNSKIVASVDAVDKLGEDVKVTETTLGRVETVVDKVAADNELIVNTVGDYKWMTDTAWGKAEDAQEAAYEANQGVTNTNARIDNIKMETDERIDGMETDISGFQDGIDNAKAEAEQAKQTAEQIRQEAQTGVKEAKDKAFEVEQTLDGFRQTVTESYLTKGDAEAEYTSKSEFTQTAKEIKGTVAEQATTIEGYANTVTTLGVKADRFETDIKQVTEQATVIAGRTTTLEQDLGGFKKTVSGTYITKTDADKNLVDAINDIQIGGSNMLLDTQKFGQANPNNVDDAYGRLININAATDTSSTNMGNTKYGNGFVRRGIPGSNTANNPDGARYQVTVKPGGVYTFSFEAFTTAGFWVYFYGPDGYIKVKKTICSTGTPLNGTNGDGAVQFNSTGAKWAHHEITWKLDSTGSTNLKYVLFRRVGSTGYTTFMAPKLEEGTKATEWSPSPFDTLYASTITSTYAPKIMVEETEERITHTAEAKYATKTQLSDEMRQSLKTLDLRGRQDGNYWLKLGRVTMEQQGKDFHIDYTGGRGFNGDTSQNSQLEIHVRSGNGGAKLFAVTLNRLLNADLHQIKAFAIDATHIDLYMTGGGQYSTGTVAYYGQYSDFSGAKQIEDISTAEGTELTVLEQSLATKSYVKQTAESVSIDVVEEFKDGKHGDKLTTQSNLTALKDEINASVKKQYADLSDQIKLANSDNAIGKNFSFESNNFDGWASHDNWTIGLSGAHTGRYYAQNIIPANSNGNQLISVGSISAEYGHTYKLEYWVKKKPNTECRGIHRISYKRSGSWEDLPSDYGTTMFLDENGTTNITGGRDYFDVTNSWTKVTTYIIPPSNVTDIRVRIIGNNPGSAETVYAVDDVSLTDYSVAKTINTTMAGINVKADSIVQEVRNDYATKDLVNRSIPGLKNPNFDVQKDGDYYTIAGWSVLGPWAETRLGNSGPVSSEGKTYFVGRSGTTAGKTLELINEGYISAYPGMKVQISWWMFVDANIIKDSNFSAGIIANNVVTRNQLKNYSTGGWKYMTTTVTVPENVSQFRVRFGFVTTGTSGWLRLDSVSVTDVTEAKAALGKATTVETNLENYKITVKDTYVDNDTVGDMQTQWKQTAKGFEASIKASGSSISVVNPGFETGDTTGWTATNFKDISVPDGALFQNTTHRFLGYRDGNNGYKMPTLANEGTVTARKNDYIKVSARILFLDESNNSLGGWMSIGVMNSYSGIVHLGDVDIMSGGWTTVSYNVQVPDDGLYSVWLVFPSTIDESTKILVDDVTMANETEAIHADTRINALETRIAMTSEGVRVGKIEDGTFKGTSALMNSEGSFDILQSEETVATLQSDYVGLMRDSDTNKYRFGVRPYEEHSTGSVDYTYEGVDLQTVGGFSLNGIPAAPASDILSIRATQTGNNYFVKYNVDTLKNDSAIFLNAATLHRDYYQRLDEGKPALAVHFKHAVGLTTTKDGDTNVSNDHIDTQVMALNPCLYGIQFVVNANKKTAGSYLDAKVKVMKTGESTWIESPALPAFRVIEVGDPVGWLTRTSPMYFVKLDVGYRFGIYISGSTSDFTIGGLNKIIITRMPFSGERMD